MTLCDRNRELHQIWTWGLILKGLKGVEGACTETVWERIPQMTLQNDSFEERVITMSKANSECTVLAI